MKVIFLFYSLFFLFSFGCTKKVAEPLADTSKLEGSWKSTDFPIEVTVNFSNVEKTAKITAVSSNSYSFRNGDVFWNEVVPTGANTFRIGQLTKSNSGYFVFVVGNATLVSDTRLELVYLGETDDTKQMNLHGKRATFQKM
jgi:hypothetical protein